MNDESPPSSPLDKVREEKLNLVAQAIQLVLLITIRNAASQSLASTAHRDEPENRRILPTTVIRLTEF